MMGMDCVNQQAVSDRDCSHCIWHTDGRCASWDCEYISRKEALEALAKVKDVQPMALSAEQPENEKRTAETAQNVPNGDLISRKMAIDELAKFVPYAICDKSTESYTNGLSDAYNLICQLPSAQPEPLTDKEQRIFLAAMGREEKVCEEVDRNHVQESYKDSLVYICREIKRKVKGALWT